jgi:KUP system potassium uptake protein
VAAVNGFFLVVDLVFVAANAIKLFEGGWFPLLLAAVVAFLMLTWRTGYLLFKEQRSRMRQREDDFIGWVLEPPRFACREPLRFSARRAPAFRSR